MEALNHSLQTSPSPPSAIIAAIGTALLLFPLAAAAAPGQPQGQSAGAAVEHNDAVIKPFRVDVPQTDLDELFRRVRATRWPDQETVPDQSQGIQLARLQELVRYWGTGYDWRKVEARLNALPQFTTNIDGVDLHFIHVRSRHKNALPVIITHGWPGSRFRWRSRSFLARTIELQRLGRGAPIAI